MWTHWLVHNKCYCALALQLQQCICNWNNATDLFRQEKSVTKQREASYSQMSQILLIQNVLSCDKEKESVNELQSQVCGLTREACEKLTIFKSRHSLENFSFPLIRLDENRIVLLVNSLIIYCINQLVHILIHSRIACWWGVCSNPVTLCYRILSCQLGFQSAIAATREENGSLLPVLQFLWKYYCVDYAYIFLT
jgi:hypothetical protein